MQLVDFFAQKRNLQDRLCACIRAQQAPAPILSTTHAPALSIPLLAAGFAIPAAGLASLVIGFGNYESAQLRWGGVGLAALIAALFVGGLLCSLAFAARAKATDVPFPLGTYLFPGALLDARAPILKHFAAENIRSAEASGSELLVTCTNTVYRFPCENPVVAANWAADFNAACTAAKACPVDARVGEDPLVLPRFDNPLAATEPMARAQKIWEKLPWIAPLAIALLAGTPLWAIRNVISDKLGATRAEAIGTVAALKAYSAVGSARKSAVDDELLPRAELKQVEAAQDLPALIQFAQAHAASAISRDIEAALARGYRREFEAAKAANSGNALRAFATKFPNHGLGREWNTALHDAYVAALGAVPKGRLAAEWLSPLYAVAETTAYRIVRVVVTSESEKGFDAVDKALAKIPEARGDVSMPSRYLALPVQLTRDPERAQKIAALFNQMNTPEYLSFAPSVDTKGGPELHVRVLTDWSGAAVASRTPRAVAVGIVRGMQVELRNHDKRIGSWSYQRKYMPQIPRSGEGPIEPELYAALNARADSEMLQEFAEAVFGKPPPPTP
jgi:hypothetical protein